MGMRQCEKTEFRKQLILSQHQPPGPYPVVIVLDNMKPNFNIGKIIRTANALGVREVHLVGIPIFDIRTCRGALKHTRTRSFESFDHSYDILATEGYQLFGLATNGEKILGATSFPEKSAFVVGHEEFGLSFDLADFPLVTGLKIPQVGQVQSLNASVAASISCFEYVRQHSPLLR